MASVETAQTPMRSLSFCAGQQLSVGYFQHDRINGMAGKQVRRATWIPSGQIHGRAVLKRMTDCVQHVGLNPKRVAGFTGPDTQSSGRRDCIARCPLSDDSAGRIRVDSIFTSYTACNVALLPLRITYVEGNSFL